MAKLGQLWMIKIHTFSIQQDTWHRSQVIGEILMRYEVIDALKIFPLLFSIP